MTTKRECQIKLL